jgi:hypothetical protein
MKLDINFLKTLTYTDVDLKDIALEVTASDAGEDEDAGVSIKGSLPLSENALKQLCSYLKVPYAFAKKLRNNKRTHALIYLQKQLSQASNLSFILVANKEQILSITTEEMLHYKGDEAVKLDTILREEIAKPTSFFDLVNTEFDEGEISYSIMYKESRDISVDPDSKWKMGYTLSHSAIGSFETIFNTQLLRVAKASLAYLPEKDFGFQMPYETDFDERFPLILNFLLSPPAEKWGKIESQISKASKTLASFREVKEARSKLSKLRESKEDLELMGRVDQELQWKRIKEEYNIKDLGFTPSKTWYARASTPNTVFDVFNCISRETTAAPNTLSPSIRKSLLSYAGSLLMRDSDLGGVSFPPIIKWD